MDPNAKKTALRMIPYGLFVLTAAKGDRVSAGTVNWVTQASFEPPLVVVGVKTDSHGHPLIKESERLRPQRPRQGPASDGLHVLQAGRQARARDISGEPFRAGKTGSPILTNTPAYIECTLETTVEMGDHSIFVGKVVEAGVAKAPEGRADDATLWLKDLGDKVFYGG